MINCKKLAQEIKEQCKGDWKPYYLKIIQVEGDEASNAYTKGKRKDCEEIGLGCQHVLLPNHCECYEVADEITVGNYDPNCIGIILQLPLPKHIEPYKQQLISEIMPSKDVDGFLPDSPFDPCTPAGILYIMKDYFKGALAGKTALIVGRGRLVGRPLAKMLDKENMTIIQANSYTPPWKIAHLLREADVAIIATGHLNTINPNMVLELHDDTLVIDAGINCDEDGKMVGDCSPMIYLYHDNITPVPGGVGLMTRAMLMKNCVDAIKLKEGADNAKI